MTNMPPPHPEKPLFSVITPVRNGARFLPYALASIASSSPVPLRKIEVLATDNASSDRSPAILREFLHNGLPLRLLPPTQPENWVASTNRALAEARGDWILFLHQDDRYAPSRFQRLLQEFQANPNHPFFVNDTTFINVNGRPLGRWQAPLPPGHSPPIRALPPMLVQNNFAVPAVAFHHSLLGEIGFLDENLPYTADWDYWARIASRYGVVRIHAPLSEFRIHPASQTMADFARHQSIMRANLEQVLSRFLPTLKPSLPTRTFNRWTRLARLGVEVNLFLAAGAAGAALPWKSLRSALYHCTPLDYPRYLALSRFFPRLFARLRAGLHQNHATHE